MPHFLPQIQERENNKTAFPVKKGANRKLEREAKIGISGKEGIY